MAERDKLLEAAHIGSAEDATASHADGEAMLADIESNYKWANMKLDIDDYVRIRLYSSTGWAKKAWQFLQ